MWPLRDEGSLVAQLDPRKSRKSLVRSLEKWISDLVNVDNISECLLHSMMNDNIRIITKVATLGWMAVNSTNRKKFPVRIF